MAKKTGKKATGAKVDEEVLERLRDCVFWIGQGLTMNQCIEDAIVAKCEALEKKHNEGKQFPRRTTELPRSNRKPPPKKETK